MPDIVRAKHLGPAPARGADQHPLRLSHDEIRAVRRAQRQPAGGARDGGLAWICLLRPLFDPRNLAPALLDAFHPGGNRIVAARDFQLSLVRGHGVGRHGPDQGNLHYPRWLRRAGGVRHLDFASPESRAERPANQADMELSGSSRGLRRGRCLDRFLLLRHFFNWPGVKGLYQTFETWFKTGSNGNGHEKPWPYWLELIARYELPVVFGLLFSLYCPFIKNISLRYLAVYGVGCLAAYSIVHYKTPWCIIAFIWPLLFVFGAMLLIVPVKYRLVTNISLGLVLWASLITSIRLNFFRCSTFEEPYVYVQTYNDIFKLTRPLLTLAKKDPTNYQMTGHLIRGSTYPFPWILGDFTKVGYYENGNMPQQVDGDFLIVQQDKIAEVESKMHDSYFTEPLTIRPYQDTSKLYLRAKVFQSLFPGRPADFTGKAATP